MSENAETGSFLDFKKFGQSLNSGDKYEAFLIDELQQMNDICRSDKILSSSISKDTNVSICVVHDDKKQAPVYDDSRKSIIYHERIVDNHMQHKGKNGINYYTQSSLFHELVHAEQMQSGLKPAQVKMQDGQPRFVIDNAYDLMGAEAECKMLNAMYHIKAWQKEGKNLDDIKQHCLTLRQNGQEFSHGDIIPEYIDVMKKSRQQGKSDDEMHADAGKQSILSLMSGKYPEWQDMYFTQIKACADIPEVSPSSLLLSRLEQKYHISKEELDNCQMTNRLQENLKDNSRAKIMALSGRNISDTPRSKQTPCAVNTLDIQHKQMKDKLFSR